MLMPRHLLCSQSAMMNPVGMSTGAPLSLVSSRGFGRFKPPPKYVHSMGIENWYDREKKHFEENISKRKRMLMQAQRMAFLEISKMPEISETLWWNKLPTMTYDELEMMPISFNIKYGTFVSKIHEAQLHVSRELSERTENRYEHVKKLDRLRTNAEWQILEEQI